MYMQLIFHDLGFNQWFLFAHFFPIFMRHACDFPISLMTLCMTNQKATVWRTISSSKQLVMRCVRINVNKGCEFESIAFLSDKYLEQTVDVQCRPPGSTLWVLPALSNIIYMLYLHVVRMKEYMAPYMAQELSIVYMDVKGIYRLMLHLCQYINMFVMSKYGVSLQI